MSAEVKPGYKMTEVGVIPKEWDLVTAGQIGRFRGGNGFPLKFQGEETGTYPFFKVSDMNNDGNETMMFVANNYISDTTRKTLGATIFAENSIIFAKVGAAIFLERKRILAQPSCLDNNMSAFELDDKKADYRYVYHRLLHMRLSDLVSTTALPSLSGNVLSEIKLPLPPLEEQRAIATVLSDVDVLLTELDRLIAKKRDIKQAAMQQLLTGQKRLPGFSGEWSKLPFGEIARPRGARVDPRRQGAQEFCIELEHLESGTGRLLGSTTANENASLKTTFQVGDVLFGKLRAYLRKFWLADRPGVCSTEIWALEPVATLVTADYLEQIVMGDLFIEAASNAHGTHMPRSDWHVVKNLEILLPAIEEQNAIATILSDMDSELAAIEARRDKARQIKQGMMQELLTGRVRLV